MAEWRRTPCVADRKAEETLKELAKKKQVLSAATISGYCWKLALQSH